MSDIIPFTRVCSVCGQELRPVLNGVHVCSQCRLDRDWEWLQARLARTAEIFSTDTTPRIVQ